MTDIDRMDGLPNEVVTHAEFSRYGSSAELSITVGEGMNLSSVSIIVESEIYDVAGHGLKAMSCLFPDISRPIHDAHNFIGLEVDRGAWAFARECAYKQHKILWGPWEEEAESEPVDTSIKVKYVYVISCTDTDRPMSKIGIAASPEKRVRQLSTSSPHTLRLEMTRYSENAKAIEAKAHEHFSEFRKNGEWFALPAQAAIAYVNKLADEQ